MTERGVVMRESGEPNGYSAPIMASRERLAKLGGWLMHPLRVGNLVESRLEEQAREQLRRDENIARALFDVMAQAYRGDLPRIHWTEAKSLLQRFASLRPDSLRGLNPHQQDVYQVLQEKAAGTSVTKPYFPLPKQRQPSKLEMLGSPEQLTLIDLTEHEPTPTD